VAVVIKWSNIAMFVENLLILWRVITLPKKTMMSSNLIAVSLVVLLSQSVSAINLCV
jgi:hypothetical protein